MSYLIDTCVISELVRPEPHAGVVEWISGVDEGELFLSALTLGELHKGVGEARGFPEGSAPDALARS